MRPYDPKPLSLADAFKCAAQGIQATFITQRNFKIQLAVAIVAVILGFALSITRSEWAIVTVCIGLVLGLECVNTAIESIVDLVCPQYNVLAGRAKDAAAGAVFLASLASLVVGMVIFVPRILALLGITL